LIPIDIELKRLGDVVKLRLIWPVLLTLSIGRAETNEHPIVGKWAADNRTKGGLGAMLIFARDGNVASTFGAIVDFKYQVEGDTIKMIFADSDEQVTERYEIIADKLIANPADPKKREERTRVEVAQAGTAPIVGLWQFKHYTGGIATMHYRSNGLGQLSVPMKTSKGHYKVEGHELTMEFEGEPTSKMTFEVSGEHLSLHPAAASPAQAFTRVTP
jgi:hypothetical protein